MKRYLYSLILFLFAALTGGAAMAQTALVVAASDGSRSLSLSLADLKAMPQTVVVTSNEFIDGDRRFRGPLARDVLKLAGAGSATKVTLKAANDYQFDVEISEFNKYDVILALSMDGVALSSRGKGPIWLIYPMSDHAELRDPVYNSRLIWQLVRMEYR